MRHSRFGRLFSEIGVGGKGGRNIVAGENQNWCSSKMPFLSLVVQQSHHQLKQTLN